MGDWMKEYRIMLLNGDNIEKYYGKFMGKFVLLLNFIN
jgi:hypothetical protein